MKHQDYPYNVLTGKLRHAHPRPSSPEALTARIMDSIRTLPQEQAQRSKTRQLKRMLSGIAALIVTSMLVYEIARPTGMTASEYALIEHNADTPEVSSVCTRMEKIRAYVQWKQALQKRKEEKRQSLILLKSKYTQP